MRSTTSGASGDVYGAPADIGFETAVTNDTGATTDADATSDTGATTDAKDATSDAINDAADDGTVTDFGSAGDVYGAPPPPDGASDTKDGAN